MLREIAGVRQDTAEVRRRWFQDEFFDLFVWCAPTGEISAFQLAYDRNREERVLCWDARYGYLHSAVDGGARRSRPAMRATPLLAGMRRFPKYRVVSEFDARSRGLDEGIRSFVLDKALEYLPPRPRRRRG